MFDFLKNKKALSPILALLIVLGVTIVVGAVFYAWGSGMFNDTQKTTSKEISGVTNTMATDSAGKMLSLDIPETIDTKGFGDLDGNNVLDGPYNASGNLRDDKFIQEIPITITYNGVTPLKNVKVVAGDYEVTTGGYTVWMGKVYDAAEIYWLHLKKLDDGSYQLMFKDDTEYKGNMTVNVSVWPSLGLPFGPDGTDKSSYIYKFKPKRNNYNLRLYDFSGRCYTLFEVNASNPADETELFSWHPYNDADSNGDGIPDDKSYAVAKAFNSYKMLDEYFSSPEYVVGELKQGDQKTISMYMYIQYLGLYDETGKPVEQATIKVPITITSDVGILKTTEITVNVPKFE